MLIRVILCSIKTTWNNRTKVISVPGINASLIQIDVVKLIYLIILLLHFYTIWEDVIEHGGNNKNGDVPVTLPKVWHFYLIMMKGKCRSTVKN